MRTQHQMAFSYLGYRHQDQNYLDPLPQLLALEIETNS